MNIADSVRLVATSLLRVMIQKRMHSICLVPCGLPGACCSIAGLAKVSV